MIYLYVKIHNKTGLKYLGKTSAADPHKYIGSGKYWNLHLKKHGYDFSTEIIFESNDPKQIKEQGMYYSKKWDVVKSNHWANLKDEQGDVGGMEHSPESNKKRSNKLKGRIFSSEHRRKLSEAGKGRKDTRSKEVKKQAALKASAKLKGRKKPKGFGEQVSQRLRGSKLSEERIIKLKNSWTPERRAKQAEMTRLQNLNKSKNHPKT